MRRIAGKTDDDGDGEVKNAIYIPDYCVESLDFTNIITDMFLGQPLL